MFANVAFRTLSNTTQPGTPPFARPSVLLLVSLVFTGCATRQAVQLPEIDGWAARIQVLGGIDNWQFSGRIAVSAGEDGFNGKIRWEQIDDRYRATVGGPLGIGTVRIEGDGRSVTLTDKDGVRNELQNAEVDIQSRYGWTIPVQSLRYWALGIPDPTGPATTDFNDNGQLVSLAQRGWTVTISRYRSGGGQLMPSHLSAYNSDTRVRIVIDRWRFFE